MSSRGNAPKPFVRNHSSMSLSTLSLELSHVLRSAWPVLTRANSPTSTHFAPLNDLSMSVDAKAGLNDRGNDKLSKPLVSNPSEPNFKGIVAIDLSVTAMAIFARLGIARHERQHVSGKTESKELELHDSTRQSKDPPSINYMNQPPPMPSISSTQH